MKRTTLIVLALASSLTSFAANAAWPDRPVKVIVPFPAGGSADVAMRIVGKRLGEAWHQPVVIENKPGAPGMVSAAASRPDGYTLLLGAGSSVVTAPLVNKKLAYKANDFAPVSLLVTSTLILVANPNLRVKSVTDLVNYAKHHPGELNYSSPGIGSPGHLMMELFQERTGTKMTHVPYKGGAPAVQELVAGLVQLGVNATPSVIQQVQGGKLVPLAIASKNRDRSLPNVPTMEEAGIPNFKFDVWYAIFAPNKTPQEIVQKLSNDIRQVLNEARTQEMIKAQGNQPTGSTPQQLGKLVSDETQVWNKLINDRKISIDG